MDSCQEAAEYYESKSFRHLLYYQSAMSIGVCSVSLLAVYGFSLRFSWGNTIPVSIKLFLLLCLANNALESLFFAWIVFSTLFIYSTASNPCEILQSNVNCNIIRIFQTWLLLLPAFLHTAVTFDRVRALRLKNPPTSQIATSAISYIFAIIGAIVAALFTFRNADWAGSTPYCATLSTSTTRDTVCVAAAMMLMEFLSIIITAVSYKIYKRKEKKTYKVNENYQKCENRNVFFLMMPWMLAHFLTFIVFYGMVLAIPMFFDWQDDVMEMRAVIGYTNIIPYYFMISPCLILYIQRKQRRNRILAIETLTKQDISYQSYAANYGWI